jgi:hypothetical protein
MKKNAGARSKKRKRATRKAGTTEAQPDIKAVKEYVDDQLALLNRHGTPLRISTADYNSVIDRVAAVSSFGQKI